MNCISPEINELYETIAKAILDAIPDQGWTEASYHYLRITQFAEETGSFQLDDGSVGSFVVEDEGSDALSGLRRAMASQHDNRHAWYSVTVRLQPDGGFKFDFVYDALPPFEIIPSPAKWADEFRTYPRPELEPLAPRMPD
ncbi:hypothetical protein GGQ73_004441 [Rhizobium skierniewicense]|uniref:DUF600 family protein n=1 Tax=Rhizobium skierniewicense TaxID=984260 RepID=A0A7W6G4A9_9HYPH|nr:hypothetical protein [Rhizobium skierniewicense]MBB3948454.1 hypothetical protein [Rhizobium skierniewicense]